MIGWLLKATLGVLLLGAVAYLVVAVPVGRRTLFEHGVKISRTRPAKELAEDLSSATGDAIDRAKTALK